MNKASSVNTTLWKNCFPQLAHTEEPAVQRIINKSKYLEFPAKAQLSRSGAICSDYVLVVSGSIRVQVVTEKGREIILYHVRSGEGCVLTTSCLLGSTTFPAESYTDTKTEILALPAEDFELALGASSHFRHFVFNNFAQRLASVIARIEQLCSPAIDRNLAKALLTLSKENSLPVTATHQELASELGTAREVVSRHLKRFELQGWVSLGRGTIQVIAPEMLSRISDR